MLFVQLASGKQMKYIILNDTTSSHEEVEETILCVPTTSTSCLGRDANIERSVGERKKEEI